MAAKTQSHAKAAGLKTVEERTAYIADVMASLNWERGKTAKVLADVWGVSKSTVENYSAEASRRVTGDAEDARRDISAGCRKLFREAVEGGVDRAKEAKAVGELWASVSGAKAPERHQIGTLEATPEAAAAAVRAAFGDQAKRDDSADPGEIPGSATDE